MLSILIVFASHYGQTRKIAERIAARLRAAGHEVELTDAGSKQVPPPQDYDAIVLGSRIEMGRHAKTVRNYITAHRDDLRTIPSAFFSVSMAAAGPDAGPDPEGYLASTFRELEWTPSHSVAFAGGLPYRKYDWLTRLILKLISRRAGHTTDTSQNHEFTDWNRVEQFASEFARMLPDEPPVLAVRSPAPELGRQP